MASCGYLTRDLLFLSQKPYLLGHMFLIIRVQITCYVDSVVMELGKILLVIIPIKDISLKGMSGFQWRPTQTLGQS